MKKLGLMLASLCFAIIMATSAHAVPFTPTGELFIKFTGVEQVNPYGGILMPDSTPTGESNWGVAVIKDIDFGTVTETNATIGDDTLATPWYGNLQDFGDGQSQITAMFYGATPSTNQIPGGTTFNSTGGYIDLYYDDGALANTLVNVSTLLPSGRTGIDSFTDITDGEFLARLAFSPGIIEGDGVTTIFGTGTAFGGTGSNLATSYVGQINGAMVGGVLGAWDGVFDNNYFTEYPGGGAGDSIFTCTDYPTNTVGCTNVVRDMRFKNSFENAAGTWDAAGALIPGTDTASVTSGFWLDDPAQASAVPEPASMLLLGTGLAGLAGISRRRRKKVS